MRIIAIGLLAISSLTLRADDSPRALIRRGNADYGAGKYAEALERYRKAGPSSENDPTIQAELWNNEAAAHFKLGALAEARELWVRAAGLRDARFEAAARFNIGNCHYAEALRAFEAATAQAMPGRSGAPAAGPAGSTSAEPRGVDVQGVLNSLDKAIQEYRDTLRLDPQMQHARANLELAAQLKKQIEEQAEQQSESGSQPNREQDRQDQDQQNQDQQDQDQNESQSSSQPSSQPSQRQDEPEEQKTQDEQEPQSQPSLQEQQSPEMPEESESAPQSQPDSPEQRLEEQQEQDPQPVMLHLTKEEAEALIQKIRDAERQRRAILRLREVAGQKPVEKDW